MLTLILLSAVTAAPDARLAADLAPLTPAMETKRSLELELDETQRRRPTAVLYALPAPVLMAGITGLLLSAMFDSIGRGTVTAANGEMFPGVDHTSQSVVNGYAVSGLLMFGGTLLELAIWRFVIHPFDVRIEELSLALGR